MSTLEITSVIIITAIEALAVVAKTSMFLKHRLPKAVSVAFLTAFAAAFSLVKNISSDSEVILSAAVVQTVLTPVVYSLCCRRWLPAISEIYVYNIVFFTLPGAVVSMFLPAEYVESFNSSYQSLAVNAVMLAVLNLLSIIAYKHRWLKGINENLCIAVYIIAFYLARVLAAAVGIAVPDSLSMKIIGAVAAVFCVMSMIYALIVPELMLKRQQNADAASKAEINSFICRHIANQNAEIRAFRHDLANHLQVADSCDASEIRKHRDRVEEIIASYSSPTITADDEVNAILAQTKQLCLSSGIDFSVNWVNPPSEFTAEQRDNLLYRLAEMYCDSMKEKPNTEIALTADGYEIVLQCTTKQNGVQ